ncbi:MAG: Fur family transcriptional regulator [Actinomycetota bacterium]
MASRAGHTHDRAGGHTDDVAAEIERRLAASDQRLTKVRGSVIEALRDAGRPITVEEILAATPGLSQSSLYRNLAVFEAAGVAVRIQSADGRARFELSEELAGHHHHLICTRCGAIDDVALPDDLERRLDGVLADVAAKSGFAMEHHRLDVVGLCRDCR